MNEKAVFFFSSDEKKNTASRSNEWMACELLQEKKNTKKTPKKVEKKKHTPLSKKIKKNPPDPEWMPHELFLGKKNTPLYFFFPLRGKKKTRFSILNEWMTHELFRGKKKYGTFALTLEKKIDLYCFISNNIVCFSISLQTTNTSWNVCQF